MGDALPPTCIRAASRFIANTPLATKVGVVSSVARRAIAPKKSGDFKGASCARSQLFCQRSCHFNRGGTYAQDDEPAAPPRQPRGCHLAQEAELVSPRFRGNHGGGIIVAAMLQAGKLQVPNIRNDDAFKAQSTLHQTVVILIVASVAMLIVNRLLRH
jgi:hypothetical protein